MEEDKITAEIIGITGNRVYPDRAGLYRGLDRLKSRHYIFGGARGVDSDALDYISRTQPGSERTVVVPNRLVDQPVSTRSITTKNATRVIELRNSGPDRYMIRNRYIVDKSQRTVAFYDYRGYGGTYNTIEYARTNDKLETVFSLRNYDINELKGMTKEELGRWVNEMRYYKVELSSIKTMLLQMIIDVFRMTVEGFLKTLGYVGFKTLEQFWSH